MCSALLFSSGCDLTRNYTKIDRTGNKEFQEYRDAMAPRLPEPTEKAADGADAGIPDLQSYVASPSDTMKPMPLVSVAVNQTVPLRDVLFELAKQAGYGIELDPHISGSIIFAAQDKPFDYVVQRICDIAGLRYKIEEGTLRVEVDTPYSKTYKIDYLSYIRKNSGSISNNISVVSGEGADTGSMYSASGQSEADFWGELDTNLKQLLGQDASSGNLKTAATPQITAAQPNPAPVDPVVVEGKDGDKKVEVQPPAAVLQVSSLPTADTETGAGTGQENTGSAKAAFALNKQAGLITVYATERQHKLVQDYLREVRRSVAAQVLIEAKVLEVSLEDQYSAGVNWDALSDIFKSRSLGTMGINFGSYGTGLNGLTVNYNNGDLGVMLEALSTFGTVKAISSPRVTVLNNQSAVLNMAANRVYFELKIDTTTADNTSQTTIDSKAKNVPEGVLINVQPSIDLDNRTISMAIRPTITRIEQRVMDPGVVFAAQQANINLDDFVGVPEVNVQEIDSVVKMNSGQAVLMGGLMKDYNSPTQSGVPVLSEMPVFGALFRSHVDDLTKKELVIFLRATILDGDDSTGIDDTDRDLYRKFSDDRRPWKL